MGEKEKEAYCKGVMHTMISLVVMIGLGFTMMRATEAYHDFSDRLAKVEKRTEWMAGSGFCTIEREK